MSSQEFFGNCKFHQFISLCKSDSALWATTRPVLASKATQRISTQETELVAHTGASRSSTSLPFLYFCLCGELDFAHYTRSPCLPRPSSIFKFKAVTEDISLSGKPEHFPSTRLSSLLSRVRSAGCIPWGLVGCTAPVLWVFSLTEQTLKNYLDFKRLIYVC